MYEFFSLIVTAGFSVAFFHAVIPTHWLPFVAVGRAQHWTKGKTLAVTAITGLGHVSSTALLGVLLVWLGIALDKQIGAAFPLVAGGLLLLMGVLYLWRQASGKGDRHLHLFGGHVHTHDNDAHGHGHPHGGEHDHHHSPDHNDHNHIHEHAHDHGHHHGHFHAHSPNEGNISAALAAGKVPPATSDWAAITGLFALLTFSPCEGFLPIYASGVRYGWTGFAVLTLVLSVATILGMVFFTWLTLLGVERLNLKIIEKYEAAIVGITLCILGVLVIVLER